MLSAPGRWISRYVGRKRERWGRAAVIVVLGSAGLIAIDWWQRYEFVTTHKKGLAKIGILFLAVLFSPWFKYTALAVGVATVIGLHFYDLRQRQEERIPASPIVKGIAAPSDHKVTCDFAEGKWWLRLQRPAPGSGGFAVTVRHEPTGAATRYSFGSSDQAPLAWYPDHFETQMMPMKQPWGHYIVEWGVVESGQPEFKVTGGFDWQPLMGADSKPVSVPRTQTMPESRSSVPKSKRQKLADDCEETSKDIYAFLSPYQNVIGGGVFQWTGAAKYRTEFEARIASLAARLLKSGYDEAALAPILQHASTFNDARRAGIWLKIMAEQLREDE